MGKGERLGKTKKSIMTSTWKNKWARLNMED